MTHVIPVEAFLLPALILFIALLTPFVTIPIVFGVMNALMKKRKNKTASTYVIGILALFPPLYLLYMGKFSLSIEASVLFCLFSSILVLILHFLVKEEKQ